MKNPAIQAWEWIPAVKAGGKTGLRERARMGGIKDFHIWQKEAAEKCCRLPAGIRILSCFFYRAASGNERALGYDLGRTFRRSALEEALYTRLPTTTEAIRACPGNRLSKRDAGYRLFPE